MAKYIIKRLIISVLTIFVLCTVVFFAIKSIPGDPFSGPEYTDEVRAALAAGKVVICSVRPGDFTTVGHFIVLAGLTDDGRVEVRDPNRAERSAQAWDLDRVLGQCANLWALSA